jgi:hypothetical protein
MDNIIFNTITDYYKVLQRRGYHSYKDVKRILVLSFYRNFVMNDYRGLISREDYSYIERALNCLFGSTCLIPYPDYLKMGKLHIGEMTEMAQRVKTLEETEVLKAFDGDDENSDIMILSEDDNSE